MVQVSYKFNATRMWHTCDLHATCIEIINEIHGQAGHVSLHMRGTCMLV